MTFGTLYVYTLVYFTFVFMFSISFTFNTSCRYILEFYLTLQIVHEGFVFVVHFSLSLFVSLSYSLSLFIILYGYVKMNYFSINTFIGNLSLGPFCRHRRFALCPTIDLFVSYRHLFVLFLLVILFLQHVLL